MAATQCTLLKPDSSLGLPFCHFAIRDINTNRPRTGKSERVLRRKSERPSPKTTRQFTLAFLQKLSSVTFYRAPNTEWNRSRPTDSQTGADSKIIFLSQESSVDMVQEAFSLGAWGYVVKTLAGNDLFAAVESVLLGKRFVSSEQGELQPSRSNCNPSTGDTLVNTLLPG